MIDWGQGRYERTAAQLLPAARHVVGLAAAGPGEEVLDVACGTGNAALVAAQAGARATGVDAAPRLLEVAAQRAAAAGLEAAFVRGDAQELPFADASFDAVLSLFGVIFAPDVAVDVQDARLPFTAGSPEAFLAEWEADHPAFLAARALLDPLGAYDGLRAAVLEELHAGNEDPGAFRATSPYRVVRLDRPWDGPGPAPPRRSPGPMPRGEEEGSPTS